MQNAKALNKKEISTSIWQLEGHLCPLREGELSGMEMAINLCLA